MKPLRDTLLASRQKGSRRWHPSQFLQAANAPVPEDVAKAVFEALFASGSADKKTAVG